MLECFGTRLLDDVGNISSERFLLRRKDFAKYYSGYCPYNSRHSDEAKNRQ
jgi:hypothetical protein